MGDEPFNVIRSIEFTDDIPVTETEEDGINLFEGATDGYTLFLLNKYTNKEGS